MILVMLGTKYNSYRISQWSKPQDGHVSKCVHPVDDDYTIE